MAKYIVELPAGKFQVEAESPDDLRQAVAELENTPARQSAPSGAQSMVGEAGHQLGLTARWLTKGLTGLPEIVGNAANAAVNGASTVNDAIGNFAREKMGMAPVTSPRLGSVSDSVDRGLNAMGFAQPRNKVEQGVGVVSSALSGAGSINAAQSATKGLTQAANAAPSVVDMVMTELGRSPIMQAIGAGGSYLASRGAQEMGVTNPLALTAIGMVGGGMTGGAATTGGRVASGSKQAVTAFTRPGQREIVGAALQRVATNPGAAQRTMGAAEEIVPGSAPTVAQASRDPGLMSADTAMRGMDTKGLIPQRISEQNAARQRELYGIAGDESTIAAAKANQKAAWDEIGAPAFEKAKPVDIGRTVDDNPVLETIQMIRNSPKGARKSVQSALDHAEEQLTQPNADITDPATLYEIRKDLALARDGKLSGTGKDGAELSSLKNAKTELNRVIASLDDVIESGATGYKSYLSEFHQRSIPLDQLKTLQRLRSQAELAVTDQASQLPILGNKFTTLLKNNLDRGMNLRGTGPKAGNLNPTQLSTLTRIAADLDRGSAASASTMKSPGSDTFKNMSVSAVIGRILGDETGGEFMNSATGKTIARPLNFLYRMPDQEIQHLMLQAWLDPKLASQLMREATAKEVENIAAVLRRRAADNAIGATYAAE